MTITQRRRNDRHDIDRGELKLIRVSHYLWSLYRRKSEPLSERQALWSAIETMIGVKKAYRAELAIRRAEKNAKTKERFAAIR
jgi:hypothetical protein